MINRHVLQCVSCQSRTLTRTQIGHKERQLHAFPCGTCGVEIAFVLEIDQKNIDFHYLDPRNARWVYDDKEPDHTIYLSDEVLAQKGLDDRMSPFIAGFALYEDFEQYRKDEGQRQSLIGPVFDYLERCSVHFEKSNYALFDKEARLDGPLTPTNGLRVAYLYSAYSTRFAHFTKIRNPDYRQIANRIDSAAKKSPVLVQQLSLDYKSSGRFISFWKELRLVRAKLRASYAAIQPLYQLWYWKEEHRNLSNVVLTDKRFEQLKPLYVDCFETLFRLLVIGLAIELIDTNGSLEIPTRKGSMSLLDFANLSNASKKDHLKRFPLLDKVFMPVLDTEFRNGIGHNAAHYDAEHDLIELYDSKGSGEITRKVPYTEFCQKLVDLFSAFEIAVQYFTALHVMEDGEFR